VFPDRAAQIAGELQEKLEAGRYSDQDDPDDLANLLGSDLREITSDAHFTFAFSPDTGEELIYDLDDTELAARSNYGFRSVRILPGNIGYIRVDHFPDPRQGFDTATGAMQFTENTDALIFDLRYNRGGYNEMIQLLVSYLYSGDDPVKLDHFSMNADGQAIERSHWVQASLPGKRTRIDPSMS